MSKNKHENNQEEIEVKIILLGDQGVGKTNLINLATKREFNPNERSSITACHSTLKMEIDGLKFQINIWDTVGQEKYRQLTKIFFNNSKIVIFVYDITDVSSFKGIESWHQEIIDRIGDDIIKGVVGNKIDLYQNEEVLEEEGERYAESIKAKFLTISAKCDSPERFEKYLRELLKEYISKNSLQKEEKKFRLNEDKIVSKRKRRNGCALAEIFTFKNIFLSMFSKK